MLFAGSCAVVHTSQNVHSNELVLPKVDSLKPCFTGELLEKGCKSRAEQVSFKLALTFCL